MIRIPDPDRILDETVQIVFINIFHPGREDDGQSGAMSYVIYAA
jgi:hypothetical protein